MNEWSAGKWWRERGSRLVSWAWWLDDARPQHWIAAFAAALIAVDTFIKPLTYVALGLAFLAVLPWLLRLVKRLELPGGVSVDMWQLEKVTEEAKDAGLLPAQPEQPVEVAARPAYQSVFNDDPVLALAGLRIELERRINQLSENTGWDWAQTSSGQARPGLPQRVRWLRAKGILTPEEASVVSELLPLLNAAVHSRAIVPDMAIWAMQNGPALLESLDSKIQTINAGVPPRPPTDGVSYRP